MAKQARKDDLCFGTCVCHKSSRELSGKIHTVSRTVKCNSKGVARITDLVMADDGHIGIIISGSETVLANGLGVARVGDSFVGCYSGSIIEGSPNTNTGG